VVITTQRRRLLAIGVAIAIAAAGLAIRSWRHQEGLKPVLHATCSADRFQIMGPPGNLLAIMMNDGNGHEYYSAIQHVCDGREVNVNVVSVSYHLDRRSNTLTVNWHSKLPVTWLAIAVSTHSGVTPYKPLAPDQTELRQQLAADQHVQTILVAANAPSLPPPVGTDNGDLIVRITPQTTRESSARRLAGHHPNHLIILLVA
jgi:hypothetical protein